MARGRDTRGERERPPESPVEIVYSLFPRVSLSRASFFTVPITSKRLLRRLGERHKKRVRAPAREPRGNRLLPLPSRASFARSVLSCAHYFQAPATQAGRETREESASARPRVLWESFTPSPLASLSRAPRSLLCPLLPSACYAGWERDTKGECERPPESPVGIVYSLSPRVSLSRAPFFPVPITSKRLLRRLLRFMLALCFLLW